MRYFFIFDNITYDVYIAYYYDANNNIIRKEISKKQFDNIIFDRYTMAKRSVETSVYYDLKECIYFVDNYDNILLFTNDDIITIYNISRNSIIGKKSTKCKILNKRLKNNISLLNGI